MLLRFDVKSERLSNLKRLEWLANLKRLEFA